MDLKPQLIPFLATASHQYTTKYRENQTLDLLALKMASRK